MEWGEKLMAHKVTKHKKNQWCFVSLQFWFNPYKNLTYGFWRDESYGLLLWTFLLKIKLILFFEVSYRGSSVYQCFHHSQMLLTTSWSWRLCVISFRGRLCTSQFMTLLPIPGQRCSLCLFTSCYCVCFDGWITVGCIMNHVLHTSYRKDEFLTVYPADVVLFEGILMFYSQEIRDLFQMKLFVDTDPDTRLSRRGNDLTDISLAVWFK